MKYIIGNHKMNLDYATLETYLKNLKKVAKTSENQVGVCVPYVYLDLAKKVLKKSNVWYGSQNMYFENSGAYTGEVSATMLNDFNCNMVILGHSERRHIFGETNADVNKKVVAALNNNLTPILCVGETLEERNQKQTKKVILAQLKQGLKGIELNNAKNIIFAYEPVWAIGTGVSATATDAESVCCYIKQQLNKLYNTDFNFVVLYGGSMSEKNVNELLKCPSIDGGLIGGASLTIEKFKPLVDYKN